MSGSGTSSSVSPPSGRGAGDVGGVAAPERDDEVAPVIDPAPPPEPLLDRDAGWFATRRGQSTGAFLVYLAAGLLIFGLPILRHPGSTFVGWGTDPSSFMWYLAWLPHAIGHGINPLVTHEVWAPVGFNLTHATAVFGPALVLTPVTLLFGPVVAYNVMALAAPVLSAWTAFLLCREITRSFPAALVGGYLFGFSVYVMGQMLGHPNLSLVFLVPVAVLIVLRRIRGELSARRATLWLAAALVGQFLISLEVFMTLALFGAVAVGLAVLIVRAHRREILRAAGMVGAAFAICAVVVSPLLISFFAASNHAPIYDFYPTIYATDLANFAVPTSLMSVGGNAFSPVASQFTGDISEQSAYFGLPVLLMVGGFAIACWRRRWARWLFAFVAFVAVCSIGPKLHIAGTETVTMPWNAALHLPLVKYALPGRFLVYAWLGVAVMAAVWLGLRGGGGRWVLAALAVILLFPNIRGPFWRSDVHEPSFFSSGAYRQAIPEGSTALVVPFGASGDSMLWQADSGFWFRMPVGNVGVRPPPEFGTWPAMDELYSGDPGSVTDRQLEEFLGANGVRTVVVADGTPGDWGAIFATLGRPRAIGGVQVYRVPPQILARYANAPRPPG
jgi:hypothetical protein